MSSNVPRKTNGTVPGGPPTQAPAPTSTGPNSNSGRRPAPPAISQSTTTVGNQQRPTAPSGTPTSGRSTPEVHSGSPRGQKLPSRQGTMSNTPSRQGTMSNPTPSGAGAPRPASSPPSIPFKENDPAHTEHRKIYMDLIQLVENRKPADKPRIFVITDMEQDYDDLLAIIFLAEMHRMGAIQLVGFIANYQPTDERAKFLRTVVRLLGLKDVPVAAGTRGLPVDKSHDKFYYELKNTTFREQEWNNKVETVEKGQQPAELLIERVLKPNRPVTALMLSSLQDIGEFFTSQKKKPGNFKDHHNFAKFISQGGYVVVKEDEAPASGNANGTAVQQKNAKPRQNNGKPKTTKVSLKRVENMMNNQFNEPESDNYYNTLAQYRLPSDAWSREAALASRLPGSFMRQLFQYGPIGAHLQWLWMRQEFKFFWDPFNWAFRPHLNIDWYLRGRLGLKENTKEFDNMKAKLKHNPSFSSIVDDIMVIAYDCCAAVGAVGDDFMLKLGVLKEDVPSYNRPEMAGHPHRVFGKLPTDQGGIDTDRLRLVMETFMLGGLKMAAADAERMIPSKSVRHETEAARVVVSVFKDKVAMQKNEKMAEEFREEAKTATADKKRQLLNAAKAADARAANFEAKVRKAEKLKATDKVRMPPRSDIPYEQLYQEAMAAAAAAAQRS